jgi:epoxyqueuosine reductase
MKEKLKAFFEEQKIEYFSVIPLSECRLTKPHLLKKAGITSGAVIIYLLPYYTGECENISRYAASRDYHLLLKSVGDGITNLLSCELGARASSFGDHSPIDERDAAARAGLGIIGDNGLIINEKYGSYVFIGEVVTDADSALLDAQVPTRVEFCEHCGACTTACPMSKIGTCLSALTQKKGELSKEEREVIKEYGSAWGCDICSEVCPHNQSPAPTPIDFFYVDRIPLLTSEDVLGMREHTFAERAYSWRGVEPLLRNLKILEGGTRDK